MCAIPWHFIWVTVCWNLMLYVFLYVVCLSVIFMFIILFLSRLVSVRFLSVLSSIRPMFLLVASKSINPYMTEKVEFYVALAFLPSSQILYESPRITSSVIAIPIPITPEGWNVSHACDAIRNLPPVNIFNNSETIKKQKKMMIGWRPLTRNVGETKDRYPLC